MTSATYIFKAVKSSYDISQVCTARMIGLLKLVFIRSGDFKFCDSKDSMSICLKLNLLFSFYVLANLYRLFLCIPRVRTLLYNV